MFWCFLFVFLGIVVVFLRLSGEEDGFDIVNLIIVFGLDCEEDGDVFWRGDVD